jgi:hypothetical protein
VRAVGLRAANDTIPVRMDSGAVHVRLPSDTIRVAVHARMTSTTIDAIDANHAVQVSVPNDTVGVLHAILDVKGGGSLGRHGSGQHWGDFETPGITTTSI